MLNEDERFLDKKIFRRIKNNVLIEEFSRGLLSKKEIDEFGNASVSFSNTKTDFWLGILNYTELEGIIHNKTLFEKGKVPNIVAKCLDIFIMVLCEKNCECSTLEMPLKILAENIGKSNSIAGTRRGVNLSLVILKNIVFQWRAKGCEEVNELNIVKSGEIKNGTITIEFSEDFVKILKTTKHYFYMPLEILKFNDKYNINSFLFARRILFHHYRNINNTNANILTVEDLLRYCVTLPDFEMVKSSNGAITNRIIRPFERDLKNCISIFTYSYVGFTETEYNNSPNEWLKEKISITWNKYYIKENDFYSEKKRLLH